MQSASVSRAMGVNPRSLHRRRPAYLTSPATPAEIRMIHESPELLGLVTGNACLSLIVDGGRACCLPKNAGQLEIVLDSVRLVDSEKASLRAVKEAKGGGHTGAMTAGIVVTGLLIWPAAPFFLF